MHCQAELNEVINNLHTVRNRLNGNFEYKVKRLNELTKILVERDYCREGKTLAENSYLFAGDLCG